MRVVLLLVAMSMANGQPPPGAALPDPQLVLEQARARLQAMDRNLEKYVCIETVNRSYYQYLASPAVSPRSEPASACGPTADASSAAAEHLDSTDRVRLEVTIAQGRELHSWPGATRFESRDVDALIRNGPVSTGAFGSYLASVFSPTGVAFHYNGERTVDGRTLFEYGYSVPLVASRYEIRIGTAWEPAAFEGDFWLDPQSYALERLTIRANQLPPGATFCQAATTVDYQHVHIGDSDVLLPRQSQLEILLPNAGKTRNTTTFASCREYQAESEIVFDDSAPSKTAAVRSASRGVVALPIGLPVTLSLISPIDTDNAAAGDPVSARVVKPVRRPGAAEELIPAGAVVYGRIRRVEHHFSSTPYFLIVISFNRVDVQGALSPFEARREADPELARELGANLTMRDRGVRFWGVGTFLFPTTKSKVVIPAGFESKWFTLATGGR